MKKLLLFTCMLFAAWQVADKPKKYNVPYTLPEAQVALARMQHIDSVCDRAAGLIGVKLQKEDAEAIRQELKQSQSMLYAVYIHIDTTVANQIKEEKKLSENKPGKP